MGTRKLDFNNNGVTPLEYKSRDVSQLPKNRTRYPTFAPQQYSKYIYIYMK